MPSARSVTWTYIVENEILFVRRSVEGERRKEEFYRLLTHL